MSAPGPSHRALGGALLVALAGLVLAVLTTGVTRWLATAAVLGVAAPLVRTGASTAWWQARRPRVPLVLILALMVLLLGPLLLGEPPASRDHGIHYFQIRMLVEELLPSGRLWGWSPTLNHGYPYGESYPVLGYLWMAAAHLLTFGLVPLRTSYAWGLAALWMVSAVVAWRLASSIVRELRRDEASASDGPSSATVAGWAGLAAAAAWLLDPGGSREGGWNYLMFHGVWPQLLAATLWAASLGLTWRALECPTPRRLALAILALGGSLWAHPFGLLTATASVVAFVVVLVVPGARAWPGPWKTWAIVHLGGALLGAAWVATFFASAESMARAPVPWTPLGDLGAQVVQGRLFEGDWVVVGPLAGLGAIAVIRRGGPHGWLVLGSLLGMLVLGSEEAITVLRLDLVLSGFKNLQFPRYAIPLKPLWFALAGVGVGQLVGWLRARVPASTVAPSWDRDAWIRRAVAGLVLAPVVATIVPEASRLVARPVSAIDTLSSDDLAQSEAELLAALRAEAAALPPERPLVVAFMREGMTGATYPIFSIADAGGRLVLDSHIPTVNFKHRLRRTATAYASLGVTHVIHDEPIPEDEEVLQRALEPVGRFGPFTLERFAPPLGRPPRVVELRSGAFEVLVDEPERMEIDVTQVRPGGTLLVGRAPHTRWEVTLDGEVIESDSRAVDDHGLSVIAIRLPHPGRVALRYVVSEQETRAKWLSALMLLVCLGALPFGRRPLSTEAPTPRARLVTAVVLGVGTLVAVAFVVRRQAHRLEETWTQLAIDELGDDPDAPRFTLVRDLVIDDAIAIEREPERVCSGLLGKDVLADCSEARHQPSTSFLYREPYLYRCLRVSLPSHGLATLRLPAPAEGTVVVGAVLRHERRGTGKSLRWGLDGESRGPLKNDRHDFVLEPRADGRAIPLVFRNDGNAIEELCVMAAELRRP